jgi:hypothetical protein
MNIFLGSGHNAISKEQSPPRQRKDLAQPQLAERETLSSPIHHAHLQVGTHDTQRPLLEDIPMGLTSGSTRAGSLIPR